MGQYYGPARHTFDRVVTTTDYTISNKESVWVDASSNPVTVTLPPATDGKTVRIVVHDATNTITATADGTDTINGETQDLTLVENESDTLEANGNGWRVV